MPAPAIDPYVPIPPPGQDELPYDDGEPMETPKHRRQMNLLIATLRRQLGERRDVFVGGNMGLYFSALQAMSNDVRAPDVFVVLDALPDRERKSWVVWEENGRTPDVVIELLSDSTRTVDMGRKKQIYAGLKVREYYLFDPHSLALEGLRLDPHGAWAPIAPGADGDLDCDTLGLRLGPAVTTVEEETSTYLRWKTPDGRVVPTDRELAGEANARADRLAERLRAMGIDPER